jgi:integrase
MSVLELGPNRFIARVYNSNTKRRISRTFCDRAKAVEWHDQIAAQLRRPGFTPHPTNYVEDAPLVSAAARWWMEKCEQGVVRAKGGQPYKPGVLYQYRRMWEVSLFGAFGDMEVGAVRRRDVQRHVDTLVAAGHAPSTVRNSVTALRAFYRWAIREELTDTNPAKDLELPSGETPRDRIVSPADALAQVVRLGQRSPMSAEVYATAFFCGLRRGELAALRYCDVDLDARRISVVRSYDFRTQTYGTPKSRAGTREVGIPVLALQYLSRAVRSIEMDVPVWAPVGVRLAGEQARKEADMVGLHEARHTYASVCIAAGVNIKTIATWMGHADVSITLNRYGHLMPGAGDAALEQLDRYLEA